MPTEVRNPFDRSIVGTVEMAGENEIDSAIAAARNAFAAARKQSGTERATILERIVTGLRRRAAELIDLIIAEAGKPRKFAEIEVSRAQQTFAFAAEEASRNHVEVLAMEASPAGKRHTGEVKRFPIGLILGITPFNFPLNLVAHKVAPCLATGNAMIVKPSPRTPLTALLLEKIVHEAGVPRDQLRVIPFTHEFVPRLLGDERVNMLSFTGSAEVGWKLKSQCVKQRVTLELGGNAAVIVHSDADVRDAVPLIAGGAFGYAGQSCISVQRVFVQDGICEAFRNAFVDYTKREIHAGDPRNPETIAGPMIDAAARDRVLDWTNEAIRSGARALTPVHHDDNVLSPIILENVPANARIVREEVFGPVAILGSYQELDEALARVNDSRFGLQAGIFTNDRNLAERAFETLEVGGVMINQVPTFRVENMPYGGVKESGLGREGVRYAMLDMTEPRALITRLI